MNIDISPLNRIKNIHFRLVELDDAKFIWELRHHPFKSRHLHSVGPTVEDQRNWITNYKEREKKGEELYFVIENNEGKKLGTLRIYDIKDNAATYGSWIFKDEAPEKMGVTSDLLLKEFIFNNLNIEHLYFDTRKENKRVYKYCLIQGAEEIREDDTNHYFYLNQDNFMKGKKNLQKMFAIEM